MTRIGFAMTGSFCTFSAAVECLTELVRTYDVTPIMSFNAHSTDTKFGKAADFNQQVEQLTGKRIIRTIVEAEPVGTSMNLAALVIAPCTGNTLAKIANGITDTPVTMATKAQLRNNRPVLVSVSSNDALGANAKNLGYLMNSKNIFFVPFKQDAPTKKANSLIANLALLPSALEAALNNLQLQPVMC